MNSPELTRVKHRANRLDAMRSAYEDSIRAAVEAGCNKTAVAEAAGISRPTLYAILSRD